MSYNSDLKMGLGTAQHNEKHCLSYDFTGDEIVRSEHTTRRALSVSQSLKADDRNGSLLTDGTIIIYNDSADSDVTSDTVLFSALSKHINPHTATQKNYYDSYADILFWASEVLQQSPVVNALIKEAAEHNWSIGLCDLHNNGYHLNIAERKIYIDNFSLKPQALGRSDYFRNALLAIIVRSLRDIWHESRHAPFEHEFGPEETLMLERVRAADCDTVAVLAAWELRGAGFPEFWRYLIGGQEGDMALVFSRVLERDPSSFMNGTALAYTFRQWYADESRVNGCDHETLESLDDILLSYREQEGFEPFGEHDLNDSKIEHMGYLPDGRTYLSGLGETIRTDMFFSALRDEINQTHLFQIMYDVEVTMAGNVPFRDHGLAARIFPSE